MPELRTIDELLKQGESYFSQGDLPNSTTCFKNILNHDQNHLEALNNLGVISFQEGNHDEALHYFQKVYHLDDNYLEAIENTGKVLEAKGDFLEALIWYKLLLDKDGMTVDILNTMARCFFEINDLAAAEIVLKESLKMDEYQEDIINLLHDMAFRSSALAENTGKAVRKLNIGFISIWFERGQSYVTKMIRDAIATTHETFIFARTGGVYGQPMLETSGQWAVPNLTVWPHYDIPGSAVNQWIRDNNLDAVVFNEEYDWELVRAAKTTGVKVFTYLDYYKDDWRQHMDLYDAVLCSTQRTYNLVKGACRAFYVGWGVDTDMFRPPVDEPEHTFFHNAGWLGINFRKMTPAAIVAFDALSKFMPEISLFIHSQAKIDMMPEVIVEIVRNNSRIIWHEATLPPPGLYHKGRIMLFPTKLEGLGLPLFESLACGMPIIATDAPPMNEFIEHGYNGLCVKVSFRHNRADNISFPEEIVDLTDLALKMAELAHDKGAYKTMAVNARRYAENKLAFPLLSERILSVFTGVTS